MTAVDARAAAARIVGRVEREGAYSNIVSRTETKGMNPSDAGVARALAYDTLRNLRQIDDEIGRSSNRPIDAIDPPLLDQLRVGIAELGRSDRPDALTVDANVSAAKRIRRSYAGFANAVLRDAARRGLRLDSTVPGWLYDELAPAFDSEEVEEFWEASMESPRLGIRGTGPAPGFEPVPGIEGAWLGAGPVPEGFEIQDPASVAVGLSVQARPGERILDMSAAPGGKTSQLVSSGAEVVATDVHPRRTRSASRRVPEAAWVVADGRTPPFEPATFDAVLLDAPCSGLGTLRRRPEIINRTSPDDVAALADLAGALLESALRLTRRGGRVVYSVCTITPAETIDAVAGTDARPPGLGLPGRRFGPGWLLAPHLGPTDGMFIAVIDR